MVKFSEASVSSSSSYNCLLTATCVSPPPALTYRPPCPRRVALLGLAFITGGILVVLLFRGFVDNLIKAEIPLRYARLHSKTLSSHFQHSPP